VVPATTLVLECRFQLQTRGPRGVARHPETGLARALSAPCPHAPCFQDSKRQLRIAIDRTEDRFPRLPRPIVGRFSRDSNSLLISLPVHTHLPLLPLLLLLLHLLLLLATAVLSRRDCFRDCDSLLADSIVDRRSARKKERSARLSLSLSLQSSRYNRETSISRRGHSSGRATSRSPTRMLHKIRVAAG
jgi:hypothetical protein